MDTKVVKEKRVQFILELSLFEKIKALADEKYQKNLSMAARQVFTDYFLKYPEKGIEESDGTR